MTPALLNVEAVSKSFSGIPVLKDVSFTVAAGGVLGLVGENGAGKSTLMNVVGGNVAPDSGRMWLEGKPYAPRHAQDAARRGIAFRIVEARASVRDMLRVEGVEERVGRVDRHTSLADAIEEFQKQTVT